MGSIIRFTWDYRQLVMSYVIRNLNCAYNRGPIVLKINNIDIPPGEVVFFIGASGVGKSTILETLGLMNNTISEEKDSIFEYQHSINSPKENFLKIWSKSENYIADFRKRNLSFIFQNTNLFSTLNAEINAILPSLLGEKSVIESKNIANPIFKKLFTSRECNEILNNKPIFEMSGCQRQRLAFVRAISTDYNVLFADEPTGNLDWFNANNLMSYLILDVKDKKSTAIIVSHSIPLAITHADKIILIDKIKNESSSDSEPNFFGLISDDQTYKKNSDGKWYNMHDFNNGKNELIDSICLEKEFKSKISKKI